ncbi:valine--tRNA ligase [Amylibacter ulvae]|uniref:Valine--tRNA ligase n=1 Tax=Paramylibacter ulvae TaxID=1651968 RepID=A0ABQ3D8R4_9RHOB|nr:valine--tRNA ligase [Amylibacter ulvae]GHA60390.1 valine--tRNA ligase [Amylibacter ulvae]
MAMEKNFDAASAEAAIYKSWEDAGAFKAGANAREGAETFTIMIPPPNVTGVLHMGHAFNNTLQDILIRWKRMQGYDTLWQPGTDHAGIATQMVVERQLGEQGIKRTDMSREDFLAKIWEWKEQSGGTIINQLKRLGASCDFSRTAFTMAGAQGDTRIGHENSPNFHDAVIKVFVEMYNKGLIYRGKRLVNWDPHFETAISDLEVENIEVDGHMWHFKYPLADGVTYTYREKDEDGNVTLEEERDYISIATTRPETMLGDGAVAVHPDDERYAPIVGKLCEIPVGPKEHRRLIPIITDEYPDMNFGSGAVKITGAHDFNDYQVAKRGGIPMYRLMDTKGAMRADGRGYTHEANLAGEIAQDPESILNILQSVGRIVQDPEDPDRAIQGAIDEINLIPNDLRGLDRFEARKKVVEQITSEGLAVMHDVTRKVKGDDGVESEITETVPMVENKPIMQPFGDRSKVVIEPMLTDQWFVETDKIVGPALDAVRDGTVKIMPESGEKVYYHWLENIEPWCISRQLWWGHQIPVWYTIRRFDEGESKGWGSFHEREVFVAGSQNEVELCAEKFLGTQVRFVNISNELEWDREIQKSINEEIETGVWREPIWRDPDVLDTWFSSGLWPIGTLGWPEDTPEMQKYFPTSTLVTGQDILFFWVARMMMMQLAVVDQVPFDTVYLHGLVRDAKGKKMSKSTGNVMDPLDIIDEYGADALRFSSAAMAALGGVLKLDMKRIEGYRNFGTKLWNAARFAEFNECKPVADFDPKSVDQTLNKWIIGETATVLESVNNSLEQYRFNDAANALYAFVWGKVCDWYVELSKPLFQGDDAAVKAETQATMAWVLDQCLILLHPIMPYITEQLWGDIAPRDNLLVHQDWPTYTVADFVDTKAATEMNWVIGLIEQVRSVRAEMRVNAGAKIAMINLGLDANAQKALDTNLTMIKRLARIEQVSTADEAPKGAITLPVDGGSFCLPLADIIDVAAEKARLSKSIEKLEKELNGIKGKLSNEKFTANAPEAVVAENRARVETGGEELATLKAAYERVESLS